MSQVKGLLTFAMVVFMSFTALVAVTASAAAAAPADPDIVVILRGSGPIVDTPDGVPANSGCYETDLFNAKTNKRIGTGIDCLEVVGFDDLDGSGGTVPTIGDAVLVDRTTIFNFPQGKLVARGLTTVVPTLFGGASSPLYTHVVGDVDESTDNIADGCATATSGCTKRFRNATGDVRLSGIVNMTDLLVNGVFNVEFNCVFVIDLD